MEMVTTAIARKDKTFFDRMVIRVCLRVIPHPQLLNTCQGCRRVYTHDRLPHLFAGRRGGRRGGRQTPEHFYSPSELAARQTAASRERTELLRTSSCRDRGWKSLNVSRARHYSVLSSSAT